MYCELLDHLQSSVIESIWSSTTLECFLAIDERPFVNFCITVTDTCCDTFFITKVKACGCNLYFPQFNKKSRTYVTSDLSIYQLCYHMGSALSGVDREWIASRLGADQEQIESGSNPLSILSLWLAQTHHMTFGSGSSREQIGSGSGVDWEHIGSRSSLTFWASDLLREITWPWEGICSWEQIGSGSGVDPLSTLIG